MGGGGRRAEPNVFLEFSVCIVQIQFDLFEKVGLLGNNGEILILTFWEKLGENC